ncbi:hypothetical protein ACSBLW_06475 [Thioclava sp. FR2]|uniref:hypothetical protein n=1 Tax=Thioclava sp. FR2 TaxID=3445780 RepID=UPI003EB9D36A
MPYIIALLGLIGAVSYWLFRIRMARDALDDISGVASDVMAAARRFGFRKKYNAHPVEGLEDPDVAIAGAGLSFLELSGLPTAEQQNGLIVSLQHRLGHDAKKAEEAVILGRWLVTESGGAAGGLERLTRRLYKLRGAEGLQPLMEVLGDVAKASRDGQLSDRQREALADITRVFRLK